MRNVVARFLEEDVLKDYLDTFTPQWLEEGHYTAEEILDIKEGIEQLVQEARAVELLNDCLHYTRTKTGVPLDKNYYAAHGIVTNLMRRRW